MVLFCIGRTLPIRSWDQQLFQSYLSNRLQHVRVGSSSSSPGSMVCGVPQGSFLRAILFLLDSGDLQLIIESHGLTHLNVYLTCSWVDAFKSPSTKCGEDWDPLVSYKSSTSPTATSSAPSRYRLRDAVRCSPRPIGIHLDSDMSMSSHVRKTVSTCFTVLRQLRSIRRLLSRPVVQLLVMSLGLWTIR